MSRQLRTICACLVICLASLAPAQQSENDLTQRAANHARAVKLAYDAVHLAHALQYHQARTILAGMGGYTRYGHSDRITENNWFHSQIEELELQLPRMKRAAERVALTEEEAAHLNKLFADLETLLKASRKVHAAIREGDLKAANQLFYELVDGPYNDAVRAAHTVISAHDRAITMIRLRAKKPPDPSDPYLCQGLDRVSSVGRSPARL